MTIPIKDIVKLSKEQLLEYFPKDFFFNEKKQPYHHQLASIVWAMCREDEQGAALFLDMGTGKTYTAFNLLRLKGVKNKILVFTVNDVLAESLVDDIHECTHYRATTVLGTKEERLAILDEDWDVFVINYDGILVGEWLDNGKKKKRRVAKDKNLLVLKKLLETRWNCIICDESRRIKNQESTRTKAILVLSKNAKFKQILTGTPMINPLDIFSQFRFADGGRTFGNSYNHFKNKYFEKKGWSYYAKWVLKPEMTKEFMEKVHANSVRFMKDDCFDLPERKFIKHSIKLSAQQISDYKALLEENTNLSIGKLKPKDIENKFMKFQQITSGFIKVGEDDYIYYDDNPKLDFCMDLVQDAIPDTKVIIYHRFVAEGRMIEDRLSKLKIPFASMRGEVKDKDNQRRRFEKNDDVRVLVAHPKSGGIGLNFIMASVTIFQSLDWDIEARLQSSDRTYRLGQEKKTTFYILNAKNTIDECIDKSHDEGLNFMETIMSNGSMRGLL